MSDRWRVAGVYLQGCNCPSPCPCGSKCPSHQCDVAVGWHISQGGTSQVNLGGLNVIRVARTADGANSDLRNELFIDARADDRQRQALTEIFSGDRGGQPAALRAVAGEVQSVQYVPIDYAAVGGRHRLQAPGVLHADLGALPIPAFDSADGDQADAFRYQS